MIDHEYEVQITGLGDIAHKSHSFHPGSVLTHDFIACAQVVLLSERWHRSYELTYYTRSWWISYSWWVSHFNYHYPQYFPKDFNNKIFTVAVFCWMICTDWISPSMCLEQWLVFWMLEIPRDKGRTDDQRSEVSRWSKMRRSGSDQMAKRFQYLF